MKIDLDLYRSNVGFIRHYFSENQTESKELYIGLLATATSVPCIVIAYYIGEMYGFTPELSESIAVITKFYGYEPLEKETENVTKD